MVVPRIGLWAIAHPPIRERLVIGNLESTINGKIRRHFERKRKAFNFEKGRPTAINATARKLALIIWNMLVKGQNYNPPTQYIFLDEKRKLGLIKRIRKQITKFEIKPEQLGFTTT